MAVMGILNHLFDIFNVALNSVISIFLSISIFLVIISFYHYEAEMLFPSTTEETEAQEIL